MNLKTFVSKAFSNDIARRSFTKNGFDGVLTVLGVLIALFFSQITDSRVIVFSCIGSGIAMCVSGLWGAYVTESAERRLKVKRLEKHLLRSLRGSRVKELSDEAVLIVALVDGLTPLIFTVILLIPFYLTPLISVMNAYLMTFILSAITIGFLGFFIARLNKDSVLFSIIKMLSAGFVVALIIYLIELLKIL